MNIDKQQYDVFISHASEDKDNFVRLLANKLAEEGLVVWYDEFSLKPGDSLLSSIDQGIAHSRFGAVVLSPNFFMKKWTQRELDGLFAHEENTSGKVIIPIWHNVTKEDVQKYSPILAGRVALRSLKGVNKIVEQIVDVVKPVKRSLKSPTRIVNLKSIQRKETREIIIGNISVGGNSPIPILSMIEGVEKEGNKSEIKKMVYLGSEIIGIPITSLESVSIVKDLIKNTEHPIMARIFFDYRLGISAIESGVNGTILNPATLSETGFNELVVAALHYDIPICIEVKSEEMDHERLANSALKNIEMMEDKGFFNIILAMNTNDPVKYIESYRIISSKCNYPLMLNTSYVGSKIDFSVRSSISLSALLFEGIGDMLEIWNFGTPWDNYRVARSILISLGLRTSKIDLLSCPGCGRAPSDYRSIVEIVEIETMGIDKELTIAVMGCIVNGPGEAKEADIGVAIDSGKYAIIFKGGKILLKTEKKLAIPLLLEKIREF